MIGVAVLGLLGSFAVRHLSPSKAQLAAEDVRAAYRQAKHEAVLNKKTVAVDIPEDIHGMLIDRKETEACFNEMGRHTDCEGKRVASYFVLGDSRRNCTVAANAKGLIILDCQR